MKFLHPLALLLGRFCLCTIFLLSASSKLLHPVTTGAYMASKGITMVPLFLYAAAIIELIGGLSLLLGFKTRWGATLLFLFLIPVTLIMHDFWNVDAAGRELQMIMFLKNLAIMGGLLYVIGSGAGKLAIDAFSGSKKEK